VDAAGDAVDAAGEAADAAADAASDAVEGGTDAANATAEGAADSMSMSLEDLSAQVDSADMDPALKGSLQQLIETARANPAITDQVMAEVKKALGM
jgi:hypothetical protein